MKKKKIFAVAAVMTALLFATGCGDKKTEKKIQQGNEAVESADYEGAVAIFQTLEEDGESSKEIYRGLGIAYMGTGDYENAVKYLKKSLKQSDGLLGDWEYDTSFYLASAYEKSGQRKKALDVYSNILALKKDRDAYLQRGILYLEEGKTKKAEADFDRAVAKDKKDFALYLEIYGHWESAQAEGGEKYLKRLLELKATQGEELYFRGLAYEKLGEENAAMDTLRQALEKGYSKAGTALGALYAKQGNNEEALNCYEDYLEANRTEVTAYLELADYQIAAGDCQGALTTVQDGLSQDKIGDRQELLRREIICYEYLQDYETAKGKAQEYLQLFPQDAEAARELEFLLTR